MSSNVFMYCFITYSKELSYGCERSAFTIYAYDFCGTSIPPLFFWSSPSAIGWFIVPFVIYSIQRQTLRANAHILEKVFKTLFPARTYCYSSSPIIWVEFKFWIETPALHALPSFICPLFLPLPCVLLFFDEIFLSNNHNSPSFYE